MAAPLPVQQARWDSFQERSELRMRRAWLARFSAALSNLPFARGISKPAATAAASEAKPVTADQARPVVWSTQPVVHEGPIATGWWRFDARHVPIDVAEPEDDRPTAHFSARTAYNPFKAPSPRLSRRG